MVAVSSSQGDTVTLKHTSLTAIIAEFVFTNQFVQPAYLVTQILSIDSKGKKTTEYDLSENVAVKSPHRNAA